MDTPFVISPVVLGLCGLAVFITGLFVRRRNKLFLCFLGLLLIAVFFVKLTGANSQSELAYTSRQDYNVLLYSSDRVVAMSCLLIAGLILWLIATLGTSFSRVFPRPMQRTILIVAGCMLIINIIVYYFFSLGAAAVTTSAMGTGLFMAWQNYLDKLQMA